MAEEGLYEQSPVRSMFNGRSVFVTGASGFIGRVLLEKLLRCYPGIRNIYILLRSKKGIQPQDRLRGLLDVPVFDQIRSLDNGKQLLDKIQVLAGDIGEPNLGLSSTDVTKLLEDKSLSIVFHSAATIKFDEPIKISIALNLKSTKTIIELCRKLPNLLSLCHVSTAYVNSDIKDGTLIEEKLYNMKDKPEQVIQLANLMDENLMQALKETLVEKRPNTYTYTKALAEHLIFNEASDLPVAIVRPSIVVAAWREPVPGWIDNINGPTGLLLAIGQGLLRTLHVSRTVKADVIPVDVVVNTMIASSYYAAKSYGKLGQTPAITVKQQSNETKLEDKAIQNKMESCSLEQAPKPTIIHCNSGYLNPITWGEMEDMFFPIIRKYPSRRVFRYPFGSFKSNKYCDLFTRLFVHYLPALIIDLICGLMGKKRQLLSIYNKLHSATAVLSHFCTHNYNFKSENIKLLEANLVERDCKELYMDIERLNWYPYWDDYVLGARRYVMKEDDHSLPGARRAFTRAYYFEITLRSFLILLTSMCLYPLINRLALV